MWTILLVEDEVFVRDSIRQTIQWEQYGFTVVGEAGDGQEALEKLTALNPDLVLCDIIMPRMDGLEFLKRAREAGFESRFVMLTCLGEFENVRQAMEYGASNYILKLSMSVQTLKDTLVKMDKELDDRKARRLPFLDSTYHIIWDQMWEEEQQANQVTLPPEYDKLCVYIEVTLDPIEHLNVLQARYPQASIHIWRRLGHTSVFYWMPDGIRNDAYKSYELAHAWKQALRKLDTAWYETEMRTEQDGLRLSSLWTWEKDWLRLIESSDSSKLMTFIDEVWDQLQQEQISMPIVKKMAERWINLCGIAYKLPLQKEYTLTSRRHFDLRDSMKQTIEQATNDWNRKFYDQTDHPEVNKIIEYIHQNYDQEITVKSMADYTIMRDNYLSGLFKKKTGKNLIHYVHDIRINKAIQLLIHTDMSIAEIVQQVGFMNDNYFNKIFKRVTKLTPSDYRRTRG